MKVLRKRTIWILLALFLLPVLLLSIWYGRQVRQQRLDHALIEAIKKEDTNMAIALLDHGADANAVDKSDVPITLQSLLANFWSRLKADTMHFPPALLVPYEIQDIQKSAGWKIANPQSDHADLVIALLKHGANPDVTDDNGFSLLYYEVSDGHTKTVKALLEHGINPDAKGKIGYTPLLFANDDCAKLLIKAGADVNARYADGTTMLMHGYRQDIYPLLLNHKADINAQDKDGFTPLIHATLSQDVRAVYFLLQHEANTFIKSKDGHTALDYAQMNEMKDIIPLKDIILLIQAASKKEQTEYKSPSPTATK